MSHYGGAELPEAVERFAATNYKYGADGRLLDRSNKIPGERIALIAVPENFRGLCIESRNIGSRESTKTRSGPGP